MPWTKSCYCKEQKASDAQLMLLKQSYTIPGLACGGLPRCAGSRSGYQPIEAPF
jgi:hypothetical protein